MAQWKIASMKLVGHEFHSTIGGRILAFFEAVPSEFYGKNLTGEIFLNRFSRLSNLTFCGSNSYPKQGTNVCLIRYSIYSTLKTLPIADQLTFDFVGLWEFESISLCHLNSQVFCSSDGF